MMFLHAYSTNKSLLFSNACTLGTCPSAALATLPPGDTWLVVWNLTEQARCVIDDSFVVIGGVCSLSWFGFLSCRRTSSLSRRFLLTCWSGWWSWTHRLLQLAFVWRACETFSMTDTTFLRVQWAILAWQWNQMMKRHERVRICCLHFIVSVFLRRRFRIVCSDISLFWCMEACGWFHFL